MLLTIYSSIILKNRLEASVLTFMYSFFLLIPLSYHRHYQRIVWSPCLFDFPQPVFKYSILIHSLLFFVYEISKTYWSMDPNILSHLYISISLFLLWIKTFQCLLFTSYPQTLLSAHFLHLHNPKILALSAMILQNTMTSKKYLNVD